MFQHKDVSVHKTAIQCNRNTDSVTHCCDVVTNIFQHSNILKHYDTWKIFTSCHLVPNNILEGKKFFPTYQHTRV